VIQFYFEKVLHHPRQFYNLQRPKKNRQLPNILSPNEVKRIVQAVHNKKHQCILLTIYAAGLRRSELIKLRIQDIRSEEGLIFIKSGKGNKDRYVPLSKHLLQALRSYYRQYRPEYWLFEGQNGGPYSATSIQKIFRRAVQKAGVNAYLYPTYLAAQLRYASGATRNRFTDRAAFIGTQFPENDADLYTYYRSAIGKNTVTA